MCQVNILDLIRSVVPYCLDDIATLQPARCGYGFDGVLGSAAVLVIIAAILVVHTGMQYRASPIMQYHFVDLDHRFRMIINYVS